MRLSPLEVALWPLVGFLMSMVGDESENRGQCAVGSEKRLEDEKAEES